MKKKQIEFIGISFLILLLWSSLSLYSGQEIRPVTVDMPMPDFTLPAYQGGEVSLSDLKGKNILLIFPRGLAAENNWCHVCPYQYMELVEFDKKIDLRKKYNVEILFVLPYKKSKVAEWVKNFPDLLADIENWKHPEHPEKLDKQEKQRMEMAHKYFPKDFTYEKGEVPFPFPILMDTKQKVSKGLEIFTTEWSGSSVEQNIPTILIVDEQGLVQFKYISQKTFDRPSPEYLTEILSCIQ
ncbi:redoxin domain-containing protein [bacterium]|nr:redoxin domain-containing protein [bacterium]